MPVVHEDGTALILRQVVTCTGCEEERIDGTYSGALHDQIKARVRVLCRSQEVSVRDAEVVDQVLGQVRRGLEAEPIRVDPHDDSAVVQLQVVLIEVTLDECG